MTTMPHVEVDLFTTLRAEKKLSDAGVTLTDAIQFFLQQLSAGEIPSALVAKQNKKQQAYASLKKFIEIHPNPLSSAYDDPDYDPDYDLLREEAYRERGLL